MWKIGQVIVTESGPDLSGRFLRWAQGTRWTHVFLVTGQNEFVESDAFTGVTVGSMVERMALLRRQKRAWVVLDPIELTVAQRLAVVTSAKSYIGRRYDYAQALLWFFTHRFFEDGPLRVICSRLITAAFVEGADYPLFTAESVAGANAARRQDLLRQYATPASFLDYSRLTIWTSCFHGKKASTKPHSPE